MAYINACANVAGPIPVTPSFECPVPQQDAASCGTIMLATLAFKLGLSPAPALDHLSYIHRQLVDFADRLELQHGPLGLGPAPDSLVLRLAKILVDKGVPSSRAEERAHLGIKKTGQHEIQQALENSNPWLFLKSIASRPHISFQWLKADELHDKIQSKATSKFVVKPSDRKKKKQNDRASDPPLQVDSQQLQLLPDTFFAEGKPLAQISFDEVGPQASGVAFILASDVAPYVQAGKVISAKPLAILTTAPLQTDQVGTLHITELRFPALYKATKEPMLLQGSLVQLGQVAIAKGCDKVQCELVPTQAFRLAIYKDQWPGSWEDFLAHPFRCVLARFPTLVLCRKTGCGSDCPQYHAAIDEPLDQLILDLWSRNWLKLGMKFTKPLEAAVWTALIRIPASAASTIQALSGQHGLYVEPRSDCGKEADVRYGVVWIGATAYQDAFHKFKTTPHSVALCRLGMKYGVRVLAAHLEEARKTLKPDEDFMETAVQEVYKLYPVPWGTQRSALQKCLAAFGWKARVLQSIGGGSQGVGWEVGSTENQPALLIQRPEGDVVTTHVRSTTEDPRPPSVLASTSTNEAW